MCFDRENNRQITEYPLYLHEDEKGNSEIIGRKGRKVRRLEMGGGTPEGGAPYQQLVTDGEGKTVWEDRLAYETKRLVIDAEFFGIKAQFIKFSDEMPTPAHKSATTIFQSNGLAQDAEIEYLRGNVAWASDSFMCALIPNCDISIGLGLSEGTVVLPETGIYALYTEEENGIYFNGIAFSAGAASPEIEWDGRTGVVKQIDRKYIPGAMVVNYTSGSAGTVIADKTFDEIMTAIKAGSSVEARNSNGMLTEVYGLNMFTDSVISFIYMAYDPESGTTNAKIIAHMQGDTIVPAAGVV